MEDNATGTTFKAVSGKILKELKLPLPPLVEQHRIVAKIEQLMNEIDKLKA
ncbi:MAG: restriction endonuclease subunit S [Bacteroidales bacterium]|nr:restriction endonuclease subunit S [Bacteroidales bacterium]